MRNFPLQISETDKILPLKKNGKFSHPWPTESLSYWNLFKWTTTRKNAPAPTASDLDAIHSNDMPALSQTDSISSKYIMWLGHSSVLLRLNNKTFLFDPIFSQRAPAIYGPTRYRDSLVQSKENLSGVDYVLISHSHYDHLDIPSLKNLSKWFPNIEWFCGKDVGTVIKSIIPNGSKINEMNWFDSHLIPDKSVQIIYLPAQHNSVRNLIDFCKTLWGGWAICTNEFRFYFAGDTAYNALMFQTIGRLVGPFDLAAIPIGAYEPRNILRMNHICPEEAVQVHKDIGSKKSFGIHWGTFPLSDENFDDPCKDLATALDNLSCEPNEFVTLKIGQILRF